MASQTKHLWLHDEDNTVNVAPYTTLDNIKIQPDVNEDNFLSFEEDYNELKGRVNTNKNLADNAINNLDTRVTVLEGSSSGGGTSSLATPLANGLMSKEDKAKLDEIDDEANKYILPKASQNTLGGIKVDGSTTGVDQDGFLQIYSGGNGASALPGLNDVEIDALMDGDLLQYSQARRKWINVFPSEVSGGGGGGSASLEYIDFDDIIDLFNTENINYAYNLDRKY